MDATSAPSPKHQLPQPRKQPVQARSRALVDAIAEACLRILEKEGEDALTVNRIAEVSGATVGSIVRQAPAFAAEFFTTGGMFKLGARAAGGARRGERARSPRGGQRHRRDAAAQ